MYSVTSCFANLNFRVTQEVSDIVGASGQQVVQAKDIISAFQQKSQR
jgi:hypothetical protein